MNIKELHEKEPLQMIEVSKNIKTIFQPNEDLGSQYFEIKLIQTKVFTDGKLVKESDETTEKITEFYIGKEKYRSDVDTLKAKDIYFKDYSYVITYLVAQEWLKMGNLRGWFDIVKDVSIYLKDLNDKKTLKEVKKMIKQIDNNSVLYSSLFQTVLGERKNLENLKTEKISKNIYSLKK